MITNLFWLPNCGFPQRLTVDFEYSSGGIIVVDAYGTPVEGTLTADVSFTFDYDRDDRAGWDRASGLSITHYAIYQGNELLVSFSEEEVRGFEPSAEMAALIEQIQAEG